MKEKETSYVDENGKEIRSTKKGKQPKENIPGYKFVTTNKLPNGDTEHVYEKVTTPSKKERGIFRDTEGNKIPGFEFDMLSPVLDIPEYEYVETVIDQDGTVRHIYKKKTTAYSPSTPETPTTDKVLTTYVDENGELIIPKEDGEKPSKELSGYELVKTEKDANGNVRHVYRKIQKPTPVEPSQPVSPQEPTSPEKPAVPEQPKQPATPKYVEGQKELPNTGTEAHAGLAALGLLGALSGFGLLARKKKED